MGRNMRKFFRILGKVLMCIAALGFLVTLICSFPMARDMGLSLLGNVLIILSMLLISAMKLPAVALATGIGWLYVNILWAILYKKQK